jgi:enoyl-CoA hydratase/carnithine racemase
LGTTKSFGLGLVDVEEKNGIALITMKREDKLNALNRALAKAIEDALDYAAANDSIKVAVLNGAGRAFCAGADINEAKRMDSLAGRKDYQGLLAERIYNFVKPIIAMIHGYALGGGLEIALACDIRYASIETKLGCPEIKLGLIPAGGGLTQMLSRVVGRGNAMLLCLTGEMIEAERAEQIGLVDKIFSRESLDTETMRLAETIVEKDAVALELTKTAVQLADELTLSTGRKYERELVGIVLGRIGQQEASRAK